MEKSPSDNCGVVTPPRNSIRALKTRCGLVIENDPVVLTQISQIKMNEEMMDKKKTDRMDTF